MIISLQDLVQKNLEETWTGEKYPGRTMRGKKKKKGVQDPKNTVAEVDTEAQSHKKRLEDIKKTIGTKREEEKIKNMIKEEVIIPKNMRIRWRKMEIIEESSIGIDIMMKDQERGKNIEEGIEKN